MENVVKDKKKNKINQFCCWQQKKNESTSPQLLLDTFMLLKEKEQEEEVEESTGNILFANLPLLTLLLLDILSSTHDSTRVPRCHWILFQFLYNPRFC